MMTCDVLLQSKYMQDYFFYKYGTKNVQWDVMWCHNDELWRHNTHLYDVFTEFVELVLLSQEIALN